MSVTTTIEGAIAAVERFVAETTGAAPSEAELADALQRYVREHPEIRDVRQPVDDARKVPDPVMVGILEAARIDLVDHRPPPPVGLRGLAVNGFVDRIE